MVTKAHCGRRRRRDKWQKTKQQQQQQNVQPHTDSCSHSHCKLTSHKYSILHDNTANRDEDYPRIVMSA